MSQLMCGLALVIATAWPAAQTAAQGTARATFNDDSFQFSMELPPNMRQLSDAQRAAFLGVPEAQVSNRPRGESKTTELTHNYVWVDPPAANQRHRQVEVNLMDQSKWRSAQSLQAWIESGGVTVTEQYDMPRPVLAKVTKGVFTNSADRELTQITLYLPRTRGYAVIRYQCDSEDFPMVEPEFQASIDSIRLRLPIAPPPGTPNPHEQAANAIRVGVQSGAWGTLEVSGSFVLAALILAALVMGGRGKP